MGEIKISVMNIDVGQLCLPIAFIFMFWASGVFSAPKDYDNAWFRKWVYWKSMLIILGSWIFIILWALYILLKSGAINRS